MDQPTTVAAAEPGLPPPYLGGAHDPTAAVDDIDGGGVDEGSGPSGRRQQQAGGADSGVDGKEATAADDDDASCKDLEGEALDMRRGFDDAELAACIKVLKALGGGDQAMFRHRAHKQLRVALVKAVVQVHTRLTQR